jgi:NAD-dependent dihydropyrimidine dehydrogenase PreA subunit
MKHRKLLLLLAFVLLPAIGAVCGRLAGPFLARADKSVQLAAQLALEDREPRTPRTVATVALRSAGNDLTILFRQAAEQQRRIATAAVWLGAFCGLVLALHLFGLLVPGTNEFYNAKPAECLACGRCFRYCPLEQQRLDELKPPEPGPGTEKHDIPAH